MRNRNTRNRNTRNRFDTSRRPSRGYRRDARRKDSIESYEDFEDLLDAIVYEAEYFEKSKSRTASGFYCDIDISYDTVSASLWYKDEDELFSEEIDIFPILVEGFELDRNLRPFADKGRKSISLTYEGDEIWVLQDKKVRESFARAFSAAWGEPM